MKHNHKNKPYKAKSKRKHKPSRPCAHQPPAPPPHLLRFIQYINGTVYIKNDEAQVLGMLYATMCGQVLFTPSKAVQLRPHEVEQIAGYMGLWENGYGS